MGSITPWRINSLNTPAQLTSIGVPDSADSSTCTTGVLSFVVNIEEEKLIGSAVRANISRLFRGGPVKAGNEALVCLELAVETILSGVVNVNKVIVGAHSKL